jgi:hypothetical protein
MAHFNHRNSHHSWTPARTLLATLALCAVAALAPAAFRDDVRDRLRSALAWLPSSSHDESSIGTDDEVLRLRARCAALELALADATHRPANDGYRLLAPHLTSARVLGRLARGYLDPPALLSAGKRDGVSLDSLALANAGNLLDRGSDRSIAVDQLVLAGRSVWGKVVEVGDATSLVRGVTERGYRDVVQLAQFDGERAERGPRGVLEGDGDGGCRIRFVETTEAVAVGDWVLVAGLEGLVDAPLVYGRITRAEHLPAAPHWELWMKPEHTTPPPTVSVLTGRPTSTDLARQEPAEQETAQHELATRR